MERELDEAIFHAFNGGQEEVDAMVGMIARGADVNFQRRNADDTTALMAAAYVGSVHAVSRLLRAGANPRVRDRGNTAIDLAIQKGNKGCEILLRQVMAIEEGEDDEDDQEEGAYVFDIYTLGKEEVGELQGGHEGGSNGDSGSSGGSAPVVRVDGLGYVEGQNELQLVFEDDSDWSEKGDEEEDSNSEGYYANDYPDDPSSSGGSDDERRRYGSGGAIGDDEDDAYDEGLRFRHGLGMPIQGAGFGFATSGMGPGDMSSDEDDNGYFRPYGGSSRSDGPGGRFDPTRYRHTAYDPHYDGEDSSDG